MDKYEKEVAKTVLSDEEQILKELKQVYTKALQDVQSKIADLNARTDLQNAQSIVHQKKFQEAIENQIKEVLNNLETKSYDSIHGYLEDSYINGYVGHMYILQNHTGCTCVTPINQKKIVDAYTNESKISTDYYSEDPVRGRVAEDLELLKRRIKSNVSRGIISGQTWAETAYNIATGMNNSFSTAMNDAMRIARTEGHKVNQIGFVDAGDEAISKGADIVKQWDATLDQVTRPWHQEADGQIREWKDKFIVMGEEMTAPGLGGSARNVCNCRCQLLQRARWALDDAELEELKKRAEYFDLDKSIDFKDFKEKYLKIPPIGDTIENEEERMKSSSDYAVPKDLVSTREFREKFDSMDDDVEIQREYYQAAKDILKHRSGTNGEDLYFYNTRLKRWYKSTTGTTAGSPEYTEEILEALKISAKGEIVSFHNHPAGMPPSVDDINCALINGYQKGYTIGHDGTIFEYTAPAYMIDQMIYNNKVAEFIQKGDTVFDAQCKTLEYLKDFYLFDFREVK